MKSVSDKISIRALDVHHIKIDNALMIAGIKAIQNTMVKSKEIKSYNSTIQSEKHIEKKIHKVLTLTNITKPSGGSTFGVFVFALLNDDMYSEK